MLRLKSIRWPRGLNYTPALRISMHRQGERFPEAMTIQALHLELRALDARARPAPARQEKTTNRVSIAQADPHGCAPREPGFRSAAIAASRIWRTKKNLNEINAVS